ncbi:J domain-containing protein DDB_G0295729-like [Procambarus clarkii]|uniref:J domain-containing protein DDB_G0295729-like n=1 Tax=Procambarus clarkii TaxID=6728 RepID=UPI003742AC34
MCRVPLETSIFTAEFYAILYALHLLLSRCYSSYAHSSQIQIDQVRAHQHNHINHNFKIKVDKEHQHHQRSRSTRNINITKGQGRQGTPTSPKVKVDKEHQHHQRSRSTRNINITKGQGRHGTPTSPKVKINKEHQHHQRSRSTRNTNITKGQGRQGTSTSPKLKVDKEHQHHQRSRSTRNINITKGQGHQGTPTSPTINYNSTGKNISHLRQITPLVPSYFGLSSGHVPYLLIRPKEDVEGHSSSRTDYAVELGPQQQFSSPVDTRTPTCRYILCTYVSSLKMFRLSAFRSDPANEVGKLISAKKTKLQTLAHEYHLDVPHGATKSDLHNLILDHLLDNGSIDPDSHENYSITNRHTIAAMKLKLEQTKEQRHLATLERERQKEALQFKESEASFERERQKEALQFKEREAALERERQKEALQLKESEATLERERQKEQAARHKEELEYEYDLAKKKAEFQLVAAQNKLTSL